MSRISKLITRLLDMIMRIDRARWVLLCFFLFGLCILWTTFHYTVLDHSYYTELAEAQQTTEVTDSVARGTVYSDNDPAGILTMSTSLPDLAVDPGQDGSKERLITFVTDIVHDELCVYGDRSDCYEALRQFLRETEIPDYRQDETFLKQTIRTHIETRLDREYIEQVRLSDEILSDKSCIDVNLSEKPGLRCENGILIANPLQIVNPESVANIAASFVDQSVDDIAPLLELRRVRYVKLLRRLNLRSKEKIEARIQNERDAIARGLLTVEESIYSYIILENHPTRFYPERNIMAKITGFVDHQNHGHYGIEGYFDRELRGRDGVKRTKKDASGRVIGAYELTEQDLVSGVDMHLTIDRNVQKEVLRLLKQSVEETGANKGTVVVMDPHTGAIIAMADYPTFDPNEFGEVYTIQRVEAREYRNFEFEMLGKPLFVEDSENGDEYRIRGETILLRRATDEERSDPVIPKYAYTNDFWPALYVNDAIGSLYEPGSVFKAVTMAIGLDTGDVSPSDMYHDKWYAKIDRFIIRNADSECLGTHTYLHALNWSCNVGMIDIVQKIGKSLFDTYIRDFWFWRKTGITLEGEVFGKIEPYERWARARLFTMSFGQGITATPLQMAAAYSVLANGGVYMEPYIVKSIDLPSGATVENAPKPLRRVISEQTASRVTAMLVEGTRVGFAKKGAVPGYDVAGKTGTSQIAKGGQYEPSEEGRTITSFGGYAPAHAPKFVVMVKLERPRTNLYSETTSSVLFRNVTEYLLGYYRIPRTREAGE